MEVEARLDGVRPHRRQRNQWAGVATENCPFLYQTPATSGTNESRDQDSFGSLFQHFLNIYTQIRPGGSRATCQRFSKYVFAALYDKMFESLGTQL